jgi:hypothetical protein
LGRWDDNDQPTGGGWGRKIGMHGGRTKRIRFAKKIIMIGFLVIAAVVLTVFLSRSGLYIEIIQREEGMGTLQTISVRLSNNNFNSLNDVTVQFGIDGRAQKIGNMGPFSTITITPPEEDIDFENVIASANSGQIQVVKSR